MTKNINEKINKEISLELKQQNSISKDVKTAQGIHRS